MRGSREGWQQVSRYAGSEPNDDAEHKLRRLCG
jgi:hypothetical protein